MKNRLLRKVMIIQMKIIMKLDLFKTKVMNMKSLL
nr:MAG TPA: hypothetical protein [Caudoviricetes sp.]